MAIITRRYFQLGGAIARLRLEIEPNLNIISPKFIVSADLQFDDNVASVAYVDVIMSGRGWIPDINNTIVLSPDPFLGLISPDSSIWKILVNNLGIITTLKVG